MSSRCYHVMCSRNFFEGGYGVGNSWLCGFARRDGENGRRGVVTLIKKEISYYQVVKFDKVEGLTVSVDTVSGPLEIVKIYCPPQEAFDELWLDQFKRENVLICGDFNAKSVLSRE